MKKDTHITDVIFRKFKNGQVIALFPYVIENAFNNYVSSYMHIGQHSGATLELIHNTKLASEVEYNDLKNELKGLGYNLKVIKKVNTEKFLSAIKAAKNNFNK
jgi:hypothetical protein